MSLKNMRRCTHTHTYTNTHTHTHTHTHTDPSMARLTALNSRLHQLIISLSFFIGRTLTVLDAGFALKVQGSFVKGLTPFLAGVAFFFFNFMFSAPPNLKLPEDFSSFAATSRIV